MFCIFFFFELKSNLIFILVFKFTCLFCFIGCHFELYKFGYIAVSANCTCCVYWFHMKCQNYLFSAFLM